MKRDAPNGQTPRPRVEYAPGWVDQIPEELRRRSQWVVWRFEWRANKAGKGKWTKVPYQPRTVEGRRLKAMPNVPQTWGTFYGACKAYQANAGRTDAESLDGIGYVFATDDEILGIDFDDCLIDGELVGWAADWLDRLGPTYAEISPSGSGIKAFYRGRLPAKPDGSTGRRRAGYGPDRSGEIEAYDHGRYFTLTGDQWWSDHTTIAEPDADALADLAAELDAGRKGPRMRINGKSATNGKAEATDSMEPRPEVDPSRKAILDQYSDDDLLAWARNARNGAKFSALYDNGDCSGYPSGSEADCALLVMLAYWTGADAARMERLFSGSDLAQREKWERQDYRDRSIAAAIAMNRGTAPDLSETWFEKDPDDSSTHAKTVPKAPPTQSRRGITEVIESNGQPKTLPDDDDSPLPPPSWPDPPGPIAYHGLAGDAVRLIQEQTEADQVGILSQLLVAFGNAVGRGPFLRVDGTRHGLNEFLVIVGESANSRKGTSLNRSLAFLEDADPQWLKHRVRTGLSSGEGLITPVRDAVWTKENIKVKGRVTGQQDVMTDEGESDKRLLLTEPEFGSVLRVLEREGNRLSALMRTAWDGLDLATMTKSPIHATGPHISLIAHITFRELMALLSDVDLCNGLANRIVWLCVKRARYLPFGGTDVDLRPIREHFRDALIFAKSVGEMILTPEAKEVYAANYVRLSTPPPGTLGEVTSRAPAHVLRWSMLYALADQSVVVADEHILAALEIIESSNRAAAHIFGDALGNPNAEKILTALLEASDGLTRTAINANVFQGHAKADRIREALSFLVQHGRAREERREGTGGRPSLVYYACERSERSEKKNLNRDDSLSSLLSQSPRDNRLNGREVFEL